MNTPATARQIDWTDYGIWEDKDLAPNAEDA